MDIKELYKRVHELFDYHEDGYLTWKVSTANNVKIGGVAGTQNKENKRAQVGIDNKIYRLHRIIFLWHHGYMPELVDHDDRDFTNNRIGNLKEASKSCNARNCKISSNNKSGVTGICFQKHGEKWTAQIMVDRKKIHLGMFGDFNDAVLARYNKEVELNWKGCNSTSSAYLYLKNKRLLPKRMIKLYKYKSLAKKLRKNLEIA